MNIIRSFLIYMERGNWKKKIWRGRYERKEIFCDCEFYNSGGCRIRCNFLFESIFSYAGAIRPSGNEPGDFCDCRDIRSARSSALIWDFIPVWTLKSFFGSLLVDFICNTALIASRSRKGLYSPWRIILLAFCYSVNRQSVIRLRWNEEIIKRNGKSGA